MKTHIQLLVIFLIFSLLSAGYAAGSERTSAMGSYDDVKAFIKEIVKKNKLDEKMVTDAFNKSYFDYTVTALMDKPAETHGWEWYSQNLLSQERINLGKKYMETHKGSLDGAYARWSVPQNIITSVIGIESTYGKAPFKRTAVTSLGTLAFEYPRRSAYFKAELENLFIFAHKDGVDPLSIRGSYAGAIGIPQFMPSNILRYGKDGDGDGHVDLVASHADAIESIAYYMHKHGWKKDAGTVVPVELKGALPDSAFSYDPCDKKKMQTVKQLESAGVLFPDKYSGSTPAMLSRLDELDGTYFTVVFFENACPIYKYNRSIKYTAAIALLAGKFTFGR